MKKLLISMLILALVCCFGLAGCGSSGSDEAQSEEAAVTEEVESQDAEAEEVAEEAAEEAEEVQQEESKAAASAAQTEKKASTTQKSASTTQKTQTQTQKAQQPAQEQTASTEKKTGTKADAEGYTGKSLSDYTSQYGQPDSSSYSSSCLGDGQDGEHHYNGYTVYTYKDENGEEKIQGVE